MSDDDFGSGNGVFSNEVREEAPDETQQLLALKPIEEPKDDDLE